MDERLTLDWRSFLLRPEPRESQPSRPRNSRSRLEGYEPRAQFRPRPEGTMTAGSGLLALEAAKAAAEQGPELFRRYHQRLFSAQFHESLDIGNLAELAALAEQEGLDPRPITAALSDHRYRPAVMTEYQEALRFGIQAIPTVLFVDATAAGPAKAVPVVGAVETDIYRQAIAYLEKLVVEESLSD